MDQTIDDGKDDSPPQKDKPPEEFEKYIQGHYSNHVLFSMVLNRFKFAKGILTTLPSNTKFDDYHILCGDKFLWQESTSGEKLVVLRDYESLRNCINIDDNVHLIGNYGLQAWGQRDSLEIVCNSSHFYNKSLLGILVKRQRVKYESNVHTGTLYSKRTCKV